MRDNADIYEEAPPYEVLSEIGELLRDLGLSKVFAAGTVFYRARLDNSQRYSELADLGPPAKEYAKYANRFSPAGIPMFYGALDMETTIAEVYDCPRKPTRIASIGKFEPARTLHLECGGVPLVALYLNEMSLRINSIAPSRHGPKP